MTTALDTFDRADQTGLGTSAEGWSWTLLGTASINIVSNVASAQNGSVATNTVKTARADVDLGATDHYAQAVSSAINNVGSVAGPAVRFDASAETCYACYERNGNTTNDIVKIVSGTRTVLASSTVVMATGTTIRLEVNGSALTMIDGGLVYLTTTDTSITTGTRGGIAFGSAGGTDRAKFDNWMAGPLTAGGLPIVQRVSVTGTATSLTADSSAGWATPTAGNLLVTILSAVASVTAPTGFTEDKRQTDNTVVLSISHKISDGTETSITGTIASSVSCQMEVIELTSNADAAHVVGPTSGVSAGATVTSLTIPTTSAATYSGSPIAAVALNNTGSTLNPWTSDYLNFMGGGTFRGVGHEKILAGATPGTSLSWVTARRAAGAMVVYYDTSANSKSLVPSDRRIRRNTLLRR